MDIDTVINTLFLGVMSLLFAGLYTWRTYTDYAVFVAATPDGPSPVPTGYRNRLLGMFALLAVAHALAFVTTESLSSAAVHVLRSFLAQILEGLQDSITVPRLLILGLLIAGTLLGRFLTARKRKASRKLVHRYTKIRRRTIDRLRAYSFLAAFLVVVVIVFAICHAINRVIVTVMSSALANFLINWLMSVGIISAVVVTFIMVGSRRMFKAKLPEDADEEYRRRAWLEVSTVQQKEAVWYGIIFLFVPCLLYRWPVLF